MATDLQRNLAEAIVENIKKPRSKRKSRTELLKSVGYKSATAERAQKRTVEQKGVQEELEILGFSEESAKKVVEEIMLNPRVEPNARLKATDQVFKIKGSYAPEKSVSLNIEVSSEKQIMAKEVITRFLNGNNRNLTEQR